MEGTGRYGAGLTRFLINQGEWVVEIDHQSGRLAQGKSQREVRRCLERSLARQLCRLLERTATTDP